MKLTRLQRVLRLIGLLQSSGYYSPEKLAEKLDVSRRTIFRDLDILRKVGIPYYFDEDKGGYNINAHYLLPPLNLNLMEALSLMLNSRHDGGACTVPMRMSQNIAGVKVENALPSHIQHHCGAVLNHTSMRCAPHVRNMGQSRTFDRLQNAIRQRQKVKISYESFYEKELIETTLSPYHLHFDRRAWYVMAHSSMHDQTRTFKLARIREMKTLSSRFEQDKTFSIEKHFGKAWGMIPEGKIYRVKLRFSAKVAGNVAEVFWHKTQQLTRHKNGKLTFEVDVDGLGEISWWILGYADQVEVLAPNELHSRIGKTVMKMAKQYSKG